MNIKYSSCLAALVFAIVLNPAVAQNNVTGIVQSIPESIPVKAKISMVNKITGDTTTTRTSLMDGSFSMQIVAGSYTLEVIANHHYVYLDTNLVVGGDTTLLLQLIKGQYDNGTPILQSTHPYFGGSTLKFAKQQYVRLDEDPYADIVNWPSQRRRLYVSGISGQSRLNLDSVLAINTTQSPAGIYYDEQTTDSTIGIRTYGVPLGHPKLNGKTAYTWLDSLITLNANPLTRNRIRYSIYVANDQETISKRTFSDELLHTEGQGHYSPSNIHILTITGVQSLATQTSPDESYIAGIWQALKTGTNIKNHKDTIKVIPETYSVIYNKGWNMISVPTSEIDMSANAVFPEKQGAAFKYNNGYTASDTLENGKGYWIKFAEALEIEFKGNKTEKDTTEIKEKWNMIGNIGYPVPVNTIQEIPEGLIVSNFYGYDNQYKQADTLYPGKAYWIKTLEGKIVLKKP